MKKAIMLLSLLMSMAFATFAQERTVSGVITDSNGEPLPGVAVILKGTTQGTVSNIDGGYRLAVSGQNPTLVYKLVGFVEIEKAVGSSSTISFSMEEDMKQLDEVVVTALGFEESRDKMGSAPSKIAAESIVDSGEASLINGMAGKASGVNIVRSSGDPGAGSYIQIRGQSTIQSNLQPLVVVDGIPINNSSRGDGVDGVSQQSRMNDINPNDIETMQILKGASAAALWGSRAANGVIVITTKKGSSAGKKINVQYRTSYSIDQVNVKPELQSTFGQGRGGSWSVSPESWGDKISERAGGLDEVNTSGASFVSATGNVIYPINTKNSKTTYDDSNWDQVYGTGSYWENNLSISGGDRDGSFMFSISDLDQNGIIKNSSYKRTTARLNTMKRFGDKFKLTNTLNYTHTSSDRVQKGSNTAGLMLGLLRTPADFDNTDYIGTIVEDGKVPQENMHRAYRAPNGSSNPIYNNPNWTVNNQKNPSKVNRFIGSVEAQLLPASWVDVTLRTGVDYYNELRSSYFPVNSAGNTAGKYEEDNLSEIQFNTDLFARVQKEITPDLQFTGLLGFNYNQRDYTANGAEMQNFIIADAPPSFDNATSENTTPYNYYETKKIAAMYGSVNFGYKDKLFVNGTLRGEAASTYGENANSVYYYPSADAAYQILNNSTGALSFAKVRASIGQVGIEPLPYRSLTYYESAEFTESWGPSLNMSGYGGGFRRSDVSGNPNLKPEIKTEWEIGTDLRFLADKGRLGVTYFQNETKDVLFNTELAPSSGYAGQYGNSATLENQGIEVDLGYDVFSNSDWRVSLDLNWTKIENKVTDLKGTKSIFLNGFTGSSSRAVEGYPVGVLWGGKFARNEDGSYDLDDNGFPKQALEEGVIGDPNPDWRGGLGLTVSYKGFRVYALIEHSQGGDVWNGTNGVLDHFGRSGRSVVESVAPSELKTYGGGAIASGDTFRGVVRDFGAGPVALDESWYRSLGGGFGPVGEQFVEDATWTRLRELTMSYSLRSPGLKKALKVSSIDLSITGRNLFLWTDYSGVDPETNLTGVSNGRGLDYFNNPNTRSWVFTAAFNW
ncbi:SusC/RagA family TonB-linked outer membrane protein [Flammeovirga aprica]|uniref:SusC/RagA family TonB-linked outer membrane protein n=1 Tax=Flammeovirga aprica JL-4 TaxID=694437 RepID=A0A7X9P105_9BACT|nr:SusC/RagA family TonB-linked outer membrane protein [Flammeovirga aprica]NME67325.1 SusC/RagA family TonB-linked outer membrane protein [Flammeovirga aprica JL-4]